MGLNAREKKMMEELQRKAEQPDPPPVGRSVSVHIDLSDEKQVQRAIKHGFLSPEDDGTDDDSNDSDDSDDSDDDKPPTRRSYF